ncbi:MAG: hypothetical protein IPM24_06495 [Bryobacterales bacterium]|nr:hypothetical protein [Bryobacterales bacterium]
MVGDLLLNCTGGTPTPAGQPIPPVNIQIFLNTAVTSKILSGAFTESLLLLDDPGANNPVNPAQSLCLAATGVCTSTGNGAGFGYYAGGGGNNPNIFQGQLVGTNSLLWLGVPIDPPGSNRTRIIRITNVRANANALGVAGPNASPIPIIQTISASGTFSVPINNPNQTVAFIQQGLKFSVSTAAIGGVTPKTILQQCFSQTNVLVGTLIYDELFATAFKKFNVGSSFAAPTNPVAQNNYSPSLNTETGFYNPNLGGSLNANAAGLPTAGTRLKAVFNNVPAGVTLRVSQDAISNGADLARAVANEVGPYVAASASSSLVTVALSGGSGMAVWEVLEADPFAFAKLSMNVYVSYTANPGANSPALGTATVNGSYAPISTVTTASSTAPIPRFADTSVASNLFTINPCVTNLLFPFVTNQAGFDTGLAISNTSTDPFGTSPQTGSCDLYAYGANAPASITTPTVASGTTFTALASIAMPNFQGYVIATCRFQYAHGFAFVSDLGARELAMGYLALVIPDPARAASPFPLAGAGSGEQLGN